MTRTMARLALSTPMVVAAALAACSDNNDSSGGLNPPPADVIIVPGAELKGFQAYSPDTLTVSLAGAPSITVVWRNDESVSSGIQHTVTDTAAARAFDTGAIDPGKTGSVTFTSAGSFPYKCSIHSGMRGLVVVQP